MTTTTKAAKKPAPVEDVHDLVITKERPGEAIEANFEGIRAFIASVTEGYAGMVITAQDVPQAKRDRAFLNSLSTSLNQRSKEVKQRYMAPVAAFEAKVAELDAPIREAVEVLDTQVKSFEETERAAKRAELVKHYNDFAGALAEVVPFERVEDPKWLNKTCGVMAAFEEIEAGIERRIKDEATLTELGLSHPLEAKAEYFATLDISCAISRSKWLDEQEARARKLEEEKAANAKWLAEKEAAKAEPVADVPAAVITPAEEPAEEVREWVFTVSCTRPQLDSALAAVKALGLTGTVRNGA